MTTLRLSRVKKLLFGAALSAACFFTSGAHAGATSGNEVFWGGSWWSVVAVEAKSGLTKVHYIGWGNEWDEWVETSHIRKAPPALARARVGQSVEVEWEGSYWAAEIVSAQNGLFKVHYSGWGNEWDEWVELNRLRQAGPPPAATGRKP
jgi:hypothetical protein